MLLALLIFPVITFFPIYFLSEEWWYHSVCYVRIETGLVTEGRSQGTSLNNPRRVAWARIVVAEMVRNGQILNIVKAEQFLALDTDYEKKESHMRHCFFQLSIWKNGVSISWDGETVKQVWRKPRCSAWGTVYMWHICILYYNYVLYIYGTGYVA